MSSSNNQNPAGQQQLNAAINAFNTVQSQPISNLINLVRMFSGSGYKEPASHVSKLYKPYDDAFKKWTKHRLFMTPHFTEVRVDQAFDYWAEQTEFDEAAANWLNEVKAHKNFIGPLAYDTGNRQWAFAFGSKQQAMLFKLAHGGVA